MQTETPTPSAPSAPVAPVTPSAPPVPNTLAEFRAQKAQIAQPQESPVPVPQAEPPIARDLDSSMGDEGDENQQAAQPETPQGPQQDPKTWRWKDPETGVTLDMRRREHRRIKRLLEDRSLTAQENQELRRRLQGLSQPQAQQPQARPVPQDQQVAPDPRDPEPSLEQFADQADPYAAYTRSLARWEARQEHRQLQAQQARVERARAQAAQIDSAQQAWDAKVPEVKQRYPDFDAAYSELFETLARYGRGARPLVSHLLKSPHGHDLAYHLGTHPDAIEALFRAPSLVDHQQAIGELTAQVRAGLKAAPSASPITPAPAPIAPVGSGAASGSHLDASKADLQYFRKVMKPKYGMRA